jgi:hypothetical protein
VGAVDPHVQEPFAHIDVGTTKFDGIVPDKGMPKGKQIYGRMVQDCIALDADF